MIAPLSDVGELVAAFGIGIAFGACLERAGLGSAKKLMGQFTLRDLAVFKVMFSAIVTAMLGLFWLSRLGIVDLGRVYVPETFLMPQLVGGVIFGVGFGIAGLCPGTSCVAAASGRGDGLAVMIGMFGGVFAAGAAYPMFERFFVSTARGALTFPALLGVSDGLVILVVVAMALTGFAFARRIEAAAGAKA